MIRVYDPVILDRDACLGFRVRDLRCGVCGLGIWDWGLGFRVTSDQSFGFMDQGLVLRVEG